MLYDQVRYLREKLLLKIETVAMKTDFYLYRIRE